MNCKTRLLLSSILIIIGIVFSQGTVISDSFYSSSLNETRNYEIYLPESYDSGEDNYPVVYFLHGFGAYGSYTTIIQEIVDNLTSTDEAIEMIVVLPDGGGVMYNGSFYTNSELNGNFADYIVLDLVSHIDETYRTIPNNYNRAIGGHSMGGYGTMSLGLENTDIFSSISTHSGPIALEELDNDNLILYLQIENGFGDFDPDNGGLTEMLFAMSAAFTPNLDNPPYYVDLPFTPGGVVVDEIFDQWMYHDPNHFVEEFIDELNASQIYFDCGQWDELQLHSHGEVFSQHLTELGIDHEFVSYPGNHTSGVYERIQYSFTLHSDHFQNAQEGLPGDVNIDGEINILDIVRTVNIILEIGPDPTESELWAADLNADGEINILDIVGIVNLILVG